MFDFNNNNTETINPAAAPSEAKLAANRENAQKSTGPTTPEGKAKSRLNAVKCGLTGNTVLFATDCVARYDTHVRSYQADFQPVGPEECDLVQSIADIRWRLNRVPGLELAIIATASAKLIEENPSYALPEAEMRLELEARRLHEKELRNLHLHENRLARRRERETAELRVLQDARKAREEERLATAAKAALLAKHRNEPLTRIPGVGFDFTNYRFNTYLGRLSAPQRQKFLQEALAEEVETAETMEATA